MIPQITKRFQKARTGVCVFQSVKSRYGRVYMKGQDDDDNDDV